MFEEQLEEILHKDLMAYNLMEYVDDDDFELELIEFTKDSIYEAVNNAIVSETSVSKTMMALTFIALKYYNGSLWQHVTRLYESLNIEPKIIESKIRDNVLGLFVTKYNCERKHYQIPVMNAIVPFNYAPEFFEFANDIYTKNLDCNLDDYDVDEELNNIFNSIKNKLTDTDDTFAYNYGSRNSKIYKLIRATKNIIKYGINKQGLLIFTRDYLNKLSSFYSGKKLSINDYIDNSFDIWKQRFFVERQDFSRKNSNFTKSRNPYYTFLNNDGNVYLHTPTKRLYGDYDIDKFKLLVLENDEAIIEESSLRINHLLGGVEILQKDYILENPLNKIRCQILYEDQVVYDSKTYLYKDYLMFNDNRELSNNRDFSGLVYFIYQGVADKKITFLKSYSGYNLGFADVSTGDEFVVNDRQISFSSIIKPGIYGVKNKDLEILDKKEYIPIYSFIENVCFVEENGNNFKIRLNGEFIDNRSIEKNVNANSVSFVVNAEHFPVAGFYKVDLVNIQTGNCTESFKFIYDPKIKTTEMLISEYNMLFNYSGSFKFVNKSKKEINDIELMITNTAYEKFYLEVDEELYLCNIIVNIPYYFIDDNPKRSYLTSITIDDIGIHSELFFNIDNCEEISYCINDVKKEFIINEREKKKYINISELLNYRDIKYLDIEFKTSLGSNYNLKVYYDLVYDYENSLILIDSKNNNVQFKSVFNGAKENDRVFLRLENRFCVIYDGKIDLNTGINNIALNESIQKLHCTIYKKVTNSVGFKIVEEDQIICERNFAYYPLKGLLGKYLYITGVQLQEDDSDVLNPVRNLSLKLIKQTGDGQFLGFLYKNDNFKLTSFEKIGMLNINLSQVYKDNYSYCCDADIYIYYNDDDSDEKWVDNLQYDENKQFIIDGYDNKSKYIDKYKIDLTLGEKLYAKYKSNKKS